jgi:hypothetical protein
VDADALGEHIIVIVVVVVAPLTSRGREAGAHLRIR